MMNKKKALTQILGPEPSEEKQGGEEKSSLRALCEELIDAVASADAEGVENCLRACYAELSQPKGE